mgnify:CR=1 FL=1
MTTQMISKDDGVVWNLKAIAEQGLTIWERRFAS